MGRSTDEQKVDIDLGIEGALRTRGLGFNVHSSCFSDRQCVQGVSAARFHTAAQGWQVLPSQRRCVFIASFAVRAALTPYMRLQAAAWCL